ncbi:MAG: hypothetical protein RL722_1174 [Pseudomonadota bacterium]|jgi:hypothetical protein
MRASGSPDLGWRRPSDRVAADHAAAVARHVLQRRLWQAAGVALAGLALAAWLWPSGKTAAPRPQGQDFPWQSLPLQVQADAPAPAAALNLDCDLDSGCASLAGAASAGRAFSYLRAQGQALGRASGNCLSLGATEVHQSGSVRRYELRSQDASGWRLQIDWGGQQALRVRLSAPGQGDYRCSGAACRGIQMSRPDAQGERQILIRQLGLVASPRPAGGAEPTGLAAQGLGPAIETLDIETPPAGEHEAGDDATTAAAAKSGDPAPQDRPAGQPALTLIEARIHIPADRLVRGLDCPEGGLDLRAADGGRSRYCASGGAGLEFLDDGGLLLHFQNLDGDTLAVRLDTQGSVRQVSLGPWACRSPSQCQGAQATASTSLLGERYVTFGRTRLSLVDSPAAGAASTASTPTGQAAWTELDGQLHLPSQE